LPDEFAATAEHYFVPLAEWLHTRVSEQRPGAFVLGINGAQGAGKSTLAAFLADYLRTNARYNVATLSIDDLYLTRAERDELARTVHPLLATRGVPGTHDPELGCALIRQMKNLGSGETLKLPRFDKLGDDRLPESAWPVVTGPVDLVLFEGWCVGSQPVADAALTEPVNELERTHDADGRWRRYVNNQLGERYQDLFALVDALVFMVVPDFDSVRRWRAEQERRLIAARSGAGSQGMSIAPVDDRIASGIDARIAEFVQYFERISRHNLVALPERANVVLRLGQDHQVVAAEYRAG
jgi:D-glycerate 3-kinase